MNKKKLQEVVITLDKLGKGFKNKMKQTKIEDVVVTLNRLGNGFKNHYMKAHKEIIKREPNKQKLIAKILLILGFGLIIFSLIHMITLLCLVSIFICLILLIKIKIEQLKKKGGFVVKLPDLLRDSLLHFSFIETQFILQENIHSVLKLIIRPFFHKDLIKAQQSLDNLSPGAKQFFTTKGILHLLPRGLQLLLLGNSIGPSQSKKKITFDTYFNSEGPTDDNYESYSDESPQKQQQMSFSQQLQTNFFANKYFNYQRQDVIRQTKQQKINQVIWDSYHVYKEKTNKGIIEITKQNFTKKMIENVLFKQKDENQKQSQNKKIGKVGKVSVLLWVIMSFFLKNPKRRITQGLLSIIYTILTVLAGGSLLFHIKRYIQQRRLKK